MASRKPLIAATERTNMDGIIMGANAAMGGEYQLKQAYAEEMQSRTIGQNINRRIAHLRAEIARLEGVREQLESGASLLDVRIEDLRQAMNY
ncbi:MAG: hypothetical protein KAZ23_01495 [Burkholderiaceae bacterium]|nr:hypothetical protein [Burkholderiaceae bacterium]